MPKKRRVTVATKFDDTRFQAEKQVREALMNTPQAKKEVRRTEKAILQQKKETKKNVVTGMKKGKK